MAVCALMVSTAGIAAASAPAAGSAELVEQPDTWDGREIEFTGEAIREAMVRGDGAWIHLNDDVYATGGAEARASLGGYNSGIGVWVDVRAAEKIGVFGDYRHRGDLVQVEGVFNAACAEHGGDMDIHASRLRVVSEGSAVPYTVASWKVPLALLLALVAVVLRVRERGTPGREYRGARGAPRAAGR